MHCLSPCNVSVSPMSLLNAGSIFTGIWIGAGVAGVLILLVVIVIALIMTKVVVKMKAGYEQKRGIVENPLYGNLKALVVKPETEKEEICQCSDGNHYEELGSVLDGLHLYEHVEGIDRKKQAPEELSTPVNVADIRELYATVDNQESMKKGVKKEEKRDESAAASNINQYALPMQEMLDDREGVVVSGDVEEEEAYM